MLDILASVWKNKISICVENREVIQNLKNLLNHLSANKGENDLNRFSSYYPCNLYNLILA